MRLKFICCSVLTRMACQVVANSKNIVDLQFVPLNQHVEPEKLQANLQAIIDTVDQDTEEYDAIIMGFGLCGNSTEGLKSSRYKIVIPRAHDCCTIFMGSVDAFLERFRGHLSAAWSSHGYIERDDEICRRTDAPNSLGTDMPFDEMVEKYGLDNAKMIYESLHPLQLDEPHIYIKMAPFDDYGCFDLYKSKIEADQEMREYQKEIDTPTGSMSLITKLVDGDWDKEFYIVQPGEMIEPSYDLELVFEE